MRLSVLLQKRWKKFSRKFRDIILYPPHLRLSLPTLLPHEPRIQRRTPFGCLEVPIYSAFYAAGEDVHSLRWILIEELAPRLAFEKLNAQEHADLTSFGYQFKCLLHKLQGVTELLLSAKL